MTTLKQASVKQPLYGHDSMETAYLVEDYPYGSMRCKIRYWLEFTPSKGFRFCSQTENPKNGRWNNPKKSTYLKMAGCMFLDEKNHVQWAGISEYSEPEEVLEFVKDLPRSNLSVLAKFVPAKIALLEKYISGAVRMTFNGEPQEMSDADRERHEKELAAWKEVAKHL